VIWLEVQLWVSLLLVAGWLLSMERRMAKTKDDLRAAIDAAETRLGEHVDRLVAALRDTISALRGNVNDLQAQLAAAQQGQAVDFTDLIDKVNADAERIDQHLADLEAGPVPEPTPEPTPTPTEPPA